MDESVEQRLLRSEEQDPANLTSRIWTESKKIWRVAFPGMVARVTSFGIIVVTQLFLGHIGELQLAAYAIEQTFFVRFVMGILMKNRIIGWFSAISFVIHVFLSWFFVIKLDWGINGAMGALNISAWLIVIGEFAYIFGGWCPNTWKGFTTAAFSDLLPVVKLSISSGFMLCLELWYNSILVLVAGYMKNAAVAISAFSICLNVSAWQFMICLAFLAAASVRVSNELGRGDAKAAKFAIKVVLFTSICIGVVPVNKVLLHINLGSYYGVGIPLGVVLGYVVIFKSRQPTPFLHFFSDIVFRRGSGFVDWNAVWSTNADNYLILPHMED
ncbi:hypothetical protein GH714_021768 [Hevea brasiliensis]|uniref:Protein DETOXIFICATION n=1 Tax=Hevea brasiliensis TaxID=3981 RepID=A0A6A6M1Z6_HEVBR|nr:hypothetical protein GH714_021768 [Hevea brasiliensis]